MLSNKEDPTANQPPPPTESVLKPGDEDHGDKAEKEKKELQELQAEDPGNQGAG